MNKQSGTELGGEQAHGVHFQTDDDGRIVFPSALAVAAAPLIGVYKWAGEGRTDRTEGGSNYAPEGNN